ncbi:metallophosphoesterase [Bacillus carboniphilus]|uniref:Phosphoesterase n=1 Tax=Bacillus carboniphilus TaxID=86663 RepID=A0ABY9K0L5_9BACI|nr:metallophosphoesterase [Bacillus carboniphilus]WLR44118.1 metallophosphoesterase [Bacillus carboniphilus]
MKALIVSDSHGLNEELITIKERHINEVDVMIHCGDSELQKKDDALEGFVVVRGNCDLNTSFPNDLVQPVDNKNVLVTHGHLYGVKNNLISLKYKAKEAGANIVCFGHSHIAYVEKIDDLLFINPGSIALPRLFKEKTYAILSVQNDEIEVLFYTDQGRNIESWSRTFKA